MTQSTHATSHSAERTIIVPLSFLSVCCGDACAAILLYYIDTGHDPDKPLIRLSVEAIQARLPDEYSQDAILLARALLVDLGLLTEHKNPQSNCDNSISYRFHPEALTELIANNGPIRH